MRNLSLVGSEFVQMYLVEGTIMVRVMVRVNVLGDEHSVPVIVSSSVTGFLRVFPICSLNIGCVCHDLIS